MPYSPFEQIATLVQSPAGVGVMIERTVSIAALAAEAADDAILCGGQRFQLTARSRFQPINRLYFTDPANSRIGYLSFE